jgi:hypothetical protein
MRVTAGRVVNGHVEVDDVVLPEGADVIVGIPENEEVAFDLNASDSELLAAAIREADRGEFADSHAVLSAIRGMRDSR